MSLQLREGEEGEEEEEDFGLCPSFNCYSTGTIADAARRAGGEFSGGCFHFDFDLSLSLNRAEENNDDDFEFVSLQKSSDCDVLRGGFIAPVFPVFNSELLFEECQVEGAEMDERDLVTVKPIRIPLEKLMIRERNDDPPSPSSSSSSSSSSVDELEAVPSGTYSVWKPKSIGTPNLACKKSRSTGSSSTKRWGIRDLLRRSHSDGKRSYVSFTPSSNSTKREKGTGIKSETKSSTELKEKKVQSGEANIGEHSRSRRSGGDQKRIFSAFESFYVRNRALKEEGKRKSYLPYKPDLVGCWRNVSGLGRASPLWSI
ncbi:uncharacterized protein LOC111435251 [Cucurbita moschata]|uniref:Uncharacterized protein LOC111435251 n=1 Tax=Cucurbita moschata TaxID=3662 RepID=A0A6J1ERP1_CUCMO|nr:uncharacterized protein LOC111435251 [Cucurbita moschata]